MTATRRVLGVDPGLAATGYGIVDGDGVAAVAVACGVLRTRPRLPRAQRLAEICERVGALIDEHHPHDLAIEQHFVAENVRSAFAVGEARAAAMIVSGEMSRHTPPSVSGRGCAAAGSGTRVPPRARSRPVHHNRCGKSPMRRGWQV